MTQLYTNFSTKLGHSYSPTVQAAPLLDMAPATEKLGKRRPLQLGGCCSGVALLSAVLGMLLSRPLCKSRWLRGATPAMVMVPSSGWQAEHPELALCTNYTTTNG